MPVAVASAYRRHADRRQGHYRDHRHADPERLAAIRRLPRRARCRKRSGATRGRRCDPRQDRHHGICRPPSRAAPATVGAKAARPADRAAVRRRRSRSARSASDLARKCSARSCGRRVSAAATVSNRRSGRSTAAAAMTGCPRASTARSPQACQRPGLVAYEIAERARRRSRISRPLMVGRGAARRLTSRAGSRFSIPTVGRRRARMLKQAFAAASRKTVTPPASCWQESGRDKRTNRRRRKRHPWRTRTVHGHQRLGVALADQYLRVRGSRLALSKSMLDLASPRRRR